MEGQECSYECFECDNEYCPYNETDQNHVTKEEKLISYISNQQEKEIELKLDWEVISEVIKIMTILFGLFVILYCIAKMQGE